MTAYFRLTCAQPELRKEIDHIMDSVLSGRLKRRVALGCLCRFLALSQPITAQEASPSPSSVSSDKKLEYRCVIGRIEK